MSKTFLNKQIEDVIETLQDVFEEIDINAFLIGAQARDIWFLPQKLPRITKDIDWVIAHSSEKVFNELKDILIKRKGFMPTPNPLKLKSLNGIEIDLIPFDYHETPHFLGLHEIFERGIEDVSFTNGKTYKVATIPAIVLLKLIAWDNLPEYRTKDILDIATILDNYFDLFSDDIFDNHNDLFDDLELNQIGARVIGRKMNDIIIDSPILRNKIISILEQNINSDNSKIAQIMVTGTDNEATYATTLLKELLNGISDTKETY
jgi:predicted nucleotidyltransferase